MILRSALVHRVAVDDGSTPALERDERVGPRHMGVGVLAEIQVQGISDVTQGVVIALADRGLYLGFHQQITRLLEVWLLVSHFNGSFQW